MVTRRNVQKEAHWREVIARQAASGVSVRRFCANEGIAEAAFYTWRRKLALRDREAQVASQAEEARAEQNGGHGKGSLATTADNGGEFIPLRLIEDSGTLEVVHPGGCRVRIGGHVDAATLHRVLEVLDERGTR